MRRLEGPYAGSIGSFSFSGTMPKDRNNKVIYSYANVMSALDNASADVVTQIRALTGKTHEQLMGMMRTAPDFFSIYEKLSQNALSLSLYAAGQDGADQYELRTARQELDMYVDLLNKLLFDYFKNDKRIHMPVMHLISLLNHEIHLVDIDYNNAARGEDAGGELGDIRGTQNSIAYNIKAGGAEAIMTPSHYESYLQICKTPEEAVRQYARYTELKGRDADPNDRLNKNEKKEYEKLKLIEKLAEQFDQSHRYMLEKSSYSQQDMDYAFSLGKKELSDEAEGGLLQHSAGKTYQSLILEKIFGGMKERYLQHISAEQAGQLEDVETWLDDEMLSCINR